MSNSIQQFLDNGIPNLKTAAEKFASNPNDFAAFVYSVRDEGFKLMLDFIGEALTTLDDVLRDSRKRCETYEIVKRDRKSLVTSLGTINFYKTLFCNKETGTSIYLIDKYLGLSANERLSEDALAEVLKESVDTSYKKGGEAASITDSVSKNTVKNKIHSLEFKTETDMKKHGRKRKADYLYIEADEDHFSLQFNNRKGDLNISESGRKLNGAITKLVYVHEGIEREQGNGRRHRLINPHYFCGAYEGTEGNNELWDEVYAYISREYDLNHIKRIYISSDGGSWIKAGMKRLHGLTYALDEFHLKKYLIKMTNHLLDSADDARRAICLSIKEDTKEEFLSYTDMLMYYAGNDTERRNVEAGREYILSNWMAAKVRLKERDTLFGCSAEAHVSHVLSRRMSTAPMGWSRHGADRMARLRAYKYNGGDMLELARYQKRKHRKAAGCEEACYSASKIISTERNHHPKWGKYVDVMQVELSAEMKKWMSIGMHSFVWHLP